MMGSSSWRVLLLSLLTCSLFNACQPSDKKQLKQLYKQNESLSVIQSTEETLAYQAIKYKEPLIHPEPLQFNYPWTSYSYNPDSETWLYPISKHHFACKGKPDHPIIFMEGPSPVKKIFDCWNSHDHGLPLKEGKEHIYPILVDLLNYIQDELKAKVIIASAHRCPVHQNYLFKGSPPLEDKHLIGAQVDFYVEGFEEAPSLIAELIDQYYFEHPLSLNSSSDMRLQRWSKKTDIRTEPWYNKEIFMKYYEADEGRNIDHSHSHPYLSIQVRWDRKRQQKVTVDWKQSRVEYLRR